MPRPFFEDLMQTSNNNYLLYLSASYSLNIDYNHEIL